MSICLLSFTKLNTSEEEFVPVQINTGNFSSKWNINCAVCFLFACGVCGFTFFFFFNLGRGCRLLAFGFLYLKTFRFLLSGI